MAIDTAAKRFSMLNFGTQPIIPLFIPDGSVDEGDRLHLLTLYSGISLSAVTPPTFNGSLSDIDVAANSEKTIDYSGYFTDATSYSISPAVESGWSFNTSTGVLTILESGVSRYGAYTITGTNTGGSANSNEFYIHVRAGSAGGNYGARKPIEDYEEEISLILKAEKEKALKEKKNLKAKEKRLEAKISIEIEQDRQKQETKLKYLEVAAMLEAVSANLVEIERRKRLISIKARILRDDDEVIMLLMSRGYV